MARTKIKTKNYEDQNKKKTTLIILQKSNFYLNLLIKNSIIFIKYLFNKLDGIFIEIRKKEYFNKIIL